jgi:hypothetical protein
MIQCRAIFLNCVYRRASRKWCDVKLLYKILINGVCPIDSFFPSLLVSTIADYAAIMNVYNNESMLFMW